MPVQQRTRSLHVVDDCRQQREDKHQRAELEHDAESECQLTPVAEEPPYRRPDRGLLAETGPVAALELAILAELVDQDRAAR